MSGTECGALRRMDIPVIPLPRFLYSCKSERCLLGQRLKASREVTIPLAFSKMRRNRTLQEFLEMAANPGPHNKVTGFFDDTDV